MTLTKDERIERDLIVQKTGLTWKGKNVFEMRRKENFDADFSKLKDNLENNGFVLEKHVLDFDSREISFTFRGPKHTLHHEFNYQWFVEIKTKEFIDDIVPVFNLIGTIFEKNGYSGSNES